MAKKSLEAMVFPTEKGFFKNENGCYFYKGIPLRYTRTGSRKNFLSVDYDIGNIELPYAEYFIGAQTLMVLANGRQPFFYNNLVPETEIDTEEDATKVTERIVRILSPLAERWEKHLHQDGSYKKYFWQVEREKKESYYKLKEDDFYKLETEKKSEFNAKYPGFHLSFCTYYCQLDGSHHFLKDRELSMSFYLTEPYFYGLRDLTATKIKDAKAALKKKLEEIEAYENNLSVFNEAKAEANRIHEELKAAYLEKCDNFMWMD